MSRSIQEILTSAFNEIKESHEVAVTEVNFNVVKTGGMSSIDYQLMDLSIDCKPCAAVNY